MCNSRLRSCQLHTAMHRGQLRECYGSRRLRRSPRSRTVPSSPCLDASFIFASRWSSRPIRRLARRIPIALVFSLAVAATVLAYVSMLIGAAPHLTEIFPLGSHQRCQLPAGTSCSREARLLRHYLPSYRMLASALLTLQES